MSQSLGQCGSLIERVEKRLKRVCPEILDFSRSQLVKLPIKMSDGVKIIYCQVKGCWKKNVTRSKFKSNFSPRTVCPRRLYFSQFSVLMSTTNYEKDSTLGQLVLGENSILNFERVTFFFNTLYFEDIGFKLMMCKMELSKILL